MINRLYFPKKRPATEQSNYLENQRIRRRYNQTSKVFTLPHELFNQILELNLQKLKFKENNLLLQNLIIILIFCIIILIRFNCSNLKLEIELD